MSEKVYVTGVGIISAIGNNIAETLKSLKDQRSGIGNLSYVNSRHKDQLSVGEVKNSNEQLMQLKGLQKGRKQTRTSLLGIHAAREALISAGIDNIKEFRTGIISATSVGGMGIVENHYKDYFDIQKKGEFLEYIPTLDCGDSTERIADDLGIKDYISTISTACSSSANSIMFGARLIKMGLLDRVVVGGTDSLSRYTINGFLSLKILDKDPCKPFDGLRKGLNLGEGAGFIVLESEKSAKKKEILCELSGYGNSNDAFHQTASSPDGAGAFLAMQKSFQVSGLSPNKIDYINAHGTGTEVNDLSEGLAIERIFGNNVPPVSSTKAFTGHTLAAAGGIEAVLSVLAIKYNTIYPNLNHSNNMPELCFTPEKSFLTNKSVNHVLSNSFGFGGNTSSLIFSKL
ncbi:MAG: beta-ketoacyl-[acyl-carrier-protein] synthase family protein [Bacteroidetes bacterium]|nr:beta-ketoacyl-[acyl-carrier-protein] synthase family protein [Bacteroidota bacterium]HET6244619.1 beta-ketoacyl-[acyl-carrier-protein] synthase family protein [Bacteroidia bacterium]